MAKLKAKSLSDIIADTPLPRRTTWTDKLAPEVREDVEQLRRDYQAGKFLHRCAVLVRAIKEKYPQIHWSEDHINRWMRKR